MKGVKSKKVLFPPFKYSWPPVETNTEDEVLRKLQDVFSQLPCLKPKRMGVKSKEKSEADMASDKQRSHIRAMLAVGANEVMRGLEKDALAAVLVCRAAEPPVLTQPLVSLTASRQCPALALTTLADRLAPALGMTSLLALGFRKQRADNTFDEIVELIRNVATPLHLPGLKVMRKASLLKTSSNSDCRPADEMEVDSSVETSITVERTLGEADSISSQGDAKPSGADEKRLTSQVMEQSKTPAPTDYSYLYVYKKAKQTVDRKFGGDFIPLGGDDGTVGNPGRIMPTYSTCEVGSLVPNSQRSRKRKRKQQK